MWMMGYQDCRVFYGACMNQQEGVRVAGNPTAPAIK